MINFGQLKNNIQILRKYLSKMNGVTECQIKPQWIEQKFIRQNNPHIFLQLLHYILIKFSPFTLFVKILDYYPTIKDDTDKKFLNNAIILSRKMFQIDAKIDLDQFLTTKFVQKKTEFVSALCKAAYEFHIKQNKPSNFIISGLENKKAKQNKVTQLFQQTISQKYINQQNDDEQAPRNLNLHPSSRQNVSNIRQNVGHIRQNVIHIKKKQMYQDNYLKNEANYLKKNENSSSDQDLKELMNNKNKLKQKTAPKRLKYIVQSEINNFPQKFYQNAKPTNIISKNNFRNNSQNEQDYQSQYNKRNNNNGVSNFQNNHNQFKKNNHNQLKENKNKKNKQSQSQQPQGHYIDLSNHITREQFMQIITSMNINFTTLLSKFNEFQGQVSGWVQNVNAKISILQQNVKTIKNNL